MSRIQEFDYSVNILRALLWRNNESVNAEGLLQAKQDWVDINQEQFWEDWYTDVFNLKTANDFGLAVWSIILGIPLSIGPALPPDDNSNWGYGALRKNFNNGNFTDAVNSIILDTEQARLVLRLRYYQLTSRPSVPVINRIMADIFGDLGLVYVLDGLDMTMTYVFTFAPSSALRLVLNQYDVLPRPAGVEVNILTQANDFFGFGSNRINFTNAPFRS